MGVRRIVLCFLPFVLYSLSLATNADTITKGVFFDKMAAGYAGRCERGKASNPGAEDDALGDCCMADEMRTMSRGPDRHETIEYKTDGTTQMPAALEALVKPVLAKCSARVARRDSPQK